MAEGFAGSIRTYVTRNIGFAFFLAWNYIALFGCGMAVGTFVPYNLEFIWIASAVSELVCALAGLGLARCGVSLDHPSWGVAGAACAVAGNIALWLSYIVIEWYWTTFAIAGLLLGVGVAVMTAVWGGRFSLSSPSAIEFDTMASFVIAFALYCVTLPIKLYGVVDLIVASALPAASMYLAFRSKGRTDGVEAGLAEAVETPTATAVAAAGEGAEEAGSRRFRDGASPGLRELEGAPASQGAFCREMRRSLSTFAMISALWFLVSFMRVVAAPVGAYDRYLHYLIPFLCAIVVAVALFALLLRYARYISITLSYRWEIPFALLVLSVLWLGHENLYARIVAYSMNFMGMFGIQLSCWMAAAKHLRRRRELATAVFLGIAAGQGLGIVLGCSAGLAAVNLLPMDVRLGAALAAVAIAVFATMLTGFNPHWRLDARSQRLGGQDARGTRDLAVETTCEGGFETERNARESRGLSAGALIADGASDADGDEPEREEVRLERLLQLKARSLQQRYGLTRRETEILELLLAGRTRPYIRDELTISLNTVHSHVSNIFQKCDVHSQQELIDLAYCRD